jgi:hypothetical protein
MSKPAYTRLSPRSELAFLRSSIATRQAELTNAMQAIAYCKAQISHFQALAHQFETGLSGDAQVLAVMLQRKWALESGEVLP